VCALSNAIELGIGLRKQAGFGGGGGLMVAERAVLLLEPESGQEVSEVSSGIL